MMTQSYTCGPSRQLGAGKVPGVGSRRVILTRPHARRPRFSTRGVPVRAMNASDDQQDREKPFRHEFPMDSMQISLSSVPTGGMYALTAALAGGAAALGFFAGGKLPEGVRGAAAPVAAVAGAATGGLGGRSLIEKRRTAAPVELYNKLHSMDDPEGLTREDVDALGEKYGVNMAQDMVMDLQRIYDQYLASVIPPGDTPLAGDEPQRIRRFIDALGLADEDAAPVHIDVARRFARSRMETGNRDAAFGELRAVQKVIYVTNLVFGEMRARYLCPWGRIFGMTDAQVFVALRDNARMLFQSHLQAQGGTVQADRQALQQLRQFQRRISLNDDVTAELVQEATRAHVEGLLDKAVECIKRRQRVKDYTDAMTAVAEIVQYNRTMTALSREDQSEVPEEEQLIHGLGAVTVQGGRYRESAAAKDCRDLLRIWLVESIERDGALSQDTESAFEELSTTLCLTASQKDDIQRGVVSEVYQTLLRAEVQSGRLEAAESPAAVLNDICQKLRYDVDAATALHRELYKNKLAGLLEKKALTDDDVADLERARRMLCVPEADYRLAHKEACGGLFQKTLEWAMAAGMDAFGADEIQEVKKAMHDVRLSEDVAKELLDEVGRRELLKFITASRMKRQPLDRAKELKRMIFFSNMVLAPLLEAMGLSEAAKKKKSEEELAKLMEEAVAAAKKEEETEKEAEKEKEAGAEAAEVVEAKVEEADAEVVEAKVEEAAPEVVEATAEAEPAKSEEEKEEEELAEEQVVSSLAKAQAAVKDEAATTMTTESGEEVKMRGQKEITLAKDLDVRDRSDIYRNYLMYCMTGDVVQLPMGGTIVMERDASEFARLSMLGELLGMTQMEVMQVHNDLSEQAFRSQVQSIMADGVLTKEKSDKLEEMRKSMGLSEESAKKILKGIQNQRLIGNLDTLKAQGELTLEKVMDLKEQGVEVETFLSEDMRVNLYRSEATSRITSGQPDLDETFLFETLPADLGLPAEKCSKAMREFAADKKRSMFIQAISELRQKKPQEAVASLNNIVSCTKVLKDTAPEQWQDRDELKDLFAMYVAQVANDSHRAEVAGILGLSEEDASAVQAAVEGGSIRVEDQRSAKSFI